MVSTRSEAHSFLDRIIEGVVNRLEDQKDRMKTELLEINIWSNQTSKGFIEIQLINRFEGDIIEKEKKIYILFTKMSSTLIVLNLQQGQFFCTRLKSRQI